MSAASKIEIPDETVNAIHLVLKDSLPQVVEEFVNQLRSQISPEQIRAKAKELIESEELRKEVSVRQVFLTLDLYEIQMANWADILNSTKDAIEEVLKLQKLEIKAANEKNRVFREVELAEVALNKAKAEEDWDIALLRFRKVKGHLILGAIFLVIGIFIGQAIEGFKGDRPSTHLKVQNHVPKGSQK